MMDDDEAFEKFIVYDEDSDTEKENIKPKLTRHARHRRTRRNQIDMMASFMECKSSICNIYLVF